MTRTELVDLIKRKRSFLCVGLDTDPSKLPDHLRGSKEGLLAFNKAIIEATLPYAVAFKLNIAFYETMGIEGWKALEQTLELIPRNEALVIADAKRGDIGNTASQYGKAFFDTLNCDAITVNPYMGEDSVTPFTAYKDRWTIVLGLTSNKGAQDIEMMLLEDGRYVFEAAMEKTTKWGNKDNLMFVVGATKPEYFRKIRAIAPEHFLLVPGVGAQGGRLEDLKRLMTEDIGVLVNSSRKIIYASSGEDFKIKAEEEARRLQQEMAGMI